MKMLSLSSFSSCRHLIALPCLAVCLSAAASALATTDTNISCPDGVYKGLFDLTIIKRDLGPIRNRLDDMTFFYGAEPDPSQGKDEIQLKSLMICSNTGEKIRTATRHIGSYRFLGQQCRIILNGKGMQS
ncbi:MAG: hypothetical protein SD837_13375 [Candidatus Electrothrix scaldis]|nr:MAG: hypothetical protein SD837_13375 [Candidatus Electrothrix sp. GW3-3]